MSHTRRSVNYNRRGWQQVNKRVVCGVQQQQPTDRDANRQYFHRGNNINNIFIKYKRVYNVYINNTYEN